MINRVLIVAVVLLGLALAAAIRYGDYQKQEAKRLGLNQQTLLEESRQYQIRDSLNAATIRVLTLRKRELNDNFEELTSLVKDMGVKLRRAESISQNATRSRYDIVAEVRDSVVRQVAAEIGDSVETQTPPILTTVRAISYKSPHIELDGVIDDSLFRGSITTYDTLTQVVHRVPRRFLFIRWGCKELRQEIVSSNPHTRITYSRVVKVE